MTPDDSAVDSRDGQSGRLPGLSVFLPTHNEEGNLERLVSRLCAELGAVAERWEVIIVDDGSTDATGAIADRLAAQDHHVRVVHHQVNRGYGGAVISGIGAARQPYLLLCDGDGQFDPSDIKRLVSISGRYDIVAGRRVNRADPLMRRLNGHAWSLLMRVLFGIRLSDVDCGFKLLRRETVKGLNLRAQGAMISAELLARAVKAGARISEVEVRHLPRLSGNPSGAKVKVILRAFGELFKLFRELR